MLEIGTRFKEDCDIGDVGSPCAATGIVGNWDSLQRGLRLTLLAVGGARSHPLEIGTRFKEDCDGEHGLGVIQKATKLEIGTRFKEDCDILIHLHHRASRKGFSWKLGLASKRIATPSPSGTPWPQRDNVGNWDSLQRGLRPGGAHTGGGARLLLEIGTRFKEDCDTTATWSSCKPNLNCWKLGLASKRIATSGGAHHIDPAIGRLEIGTRFKEDCDRGTQRK